MKPFCAAVDWGTSRFRLWLLAEDGNVLNQINTNEGLQNSTDIGFSNVLEKHLKTLECSADLPVIICGMAGSRSGWVEAQYLEAPVDLAAITQNTVSIPNSIRDIRILPGIAQRNASKPDVMRGEETQLFGMLFDENSPKKTGRNTICMPGTHSKWVTLEGTRVEHFTTFMTGELFSLLSFHSVLKLSIENYGAVAPDNPKFMNHMRQALANPQEISAQLFSLRPSHLLGYAKPGSALAALSGSLIGLELAGAFSRHAKPQHVTLMASGNLGGLYAAALHDCGVQISFCNAENAGRDGLFQAAKLLWGTPTKARLRKA